MKVVPLGDKVAVKPLEPDQMTPGGVVLPDSAQEKPRQGKIIALGDGKLLDNGQRSAFQVKAGDKVLFSAYGGTEIKWDGIEYLIMEESEILAVL